MSAAILNVFSFRVYLVFSAIGKEAKYRHMFTVFASNGRFLKKGATCRSTNSVYLRLGVLSCFQHANKLQNDMSNV